MIENLIREHVSKLTKDDVDKFGKDNNIFLNSNELDTVYNIVKNNWRELVYGDYNSIFENNRSKVSNESYTKIRDLFDFFRKKYQRFL